MHRMFIEQFNRKTHYEIHLPAQRLLADPAAVRSAQTLSFLGFPHKKEFRRYATTSFDFQRKLAEMNLQLNF